MFLNLILILFLKKMSQIICIKFYVENRKSAPTHLVYFLWHSASLLCLRKVFISANNQKIIETVKKMHKENQRITIVGLPVCSCYAILSFVSGKKFVSAKFFRNYKILSKINVVLVSLRSWRIISTTIQICSKR